MGEKELTNWLAELPEDYIKYVEYLLEKVEFQLDKYVLSLSDYNESREVIKRIKNGISNS